MSHYDTLGVPQDATPEQIKQAYRRKARKAHPDKGGDVVAMAEANRAYDTLSDAEKRRRYDETGEDRPGPTLEMEARELVLVVFDRALQSLASDPVSFGVAALTEELRNMKSKQSEFQAERARLLKKRDKVRVKTAARNLFHDLIDQKVAKLDAHLSNIARGLTVFPMALKLLKDYEAEQETPAPRGTYFYNTWTTST